MVISVQLGGCNETTLNLSDHQLLSTALVTCLQVQTGSANQLLELTPLLPGAELHLPRPTLTQGNAGYSVSILFLLFLGISLGWEVLVALLQAGAHTVTELAKSMHGVVQLHGSLLDYFLASMRGR